MFKKPYEQCIFTIRNITDLYQCFEDGGNGKFEEGRRWIEGQRLKADADSKGQPLLVLLADAGSVGNILFYGVLQKIEVPLEGHETIFTFTDLLPMPLPGLHKSELVMLDGRNVSKKHIRPYTLCHTPEFLMMSEEEIFDSIPLAETDEEVDAVEELEVVMEDDVVDEDDALLETSTLYSSNARLATYSLLQDVAYALPKRDDQKLAELRSTQTGKSAWDDETQIMLSIMMEAEFGLNISEAELAKCVTVGDFVGLVRSKAQ